MKAQLIFHVSVLFVYAFCVWRLSCLDLSNSKHEAVLDVQNYGGRYFTTWNFALHLIYFILALAGDVQEHVADSTWRNLKFFDIKYIKTHLYTILVAPSTTFVTFMFWGLYYYNRELVYPSDADMFIPEWLNQMMHSSVLIFGAIEFFYNLHDHPDVSFESAFLGITGIHIVYYTVFFYHYISIGRFLYPLFQALSWTKMMCFILGIYVFFLAVSGAVIAVQRCLRGMKSKAE